jgi:hypothetical protein
VSARAQELDLSAITSQVEVHGFVSQGLIKTTNNNYLAESERGSFEFTEIGLNFTKNITDDVRIGAQLFARDLGPLGNYTPQFDWLYLDYSFWDWLGLRAGRTKLPYGLYNEVNDIDSARVPVLLPQSVYPVQNRDFLLAQTGFELYGYLPLSEAGALEYRAYGGTIFIDQALDSDEITETSAPYVVGGRLMWQTPLEGLQVGASAQKLRLEIEYQLDSDTRAGLINAGLLPAGSTGEGTLDLPAFLWVGSVEYSGGDWLLAAEYSRWRIDTESSLPAIIPGELTVSERMYAMLSYRVAPWFTPGIYYSLLFSDTDDRSGRDAYQHDVAATFRYDLTPHWLLKLEGHYMHGTAALIPSLNDGQPLDELPSDWGVLLVKTTAYF